MPDKKKHHYVPRFYLKFFATDLEAKSPRTINMYNIPREFLISDASIADQCARDWFYGTSDNLEDAMSTLESAWASFFRDFRDKTIPPQPKSKDHLLLLLFISIQMLRTNRRALDTNESIRMMMKTITAHDSHLSATGDDFDWELKDPVFLSLRSFLPVAHYLDDLEICLLKTHMPSAFVTSDDPVFKHNLYCESFTETGNTGATNTGLLIFLPISPEFCVLFYDNGVYKVGRPGKQGPLLVTSADVDVLNGLQYVGADTNLYFSVGFSSDYFKRLSATYGKARQEIGLRTVEAEEVGNPLNILVHQYYHIPNLRLNLSFLSIRRNARRVPLADRIRSYRREIELTGPSPALGSKSRKFVPIKKSSGQPRSKV